jgi:LuxR family maltose regulon positive regulatory protein
MNVQRAFALLEQAENLGHTRNWGRLIAMAEFWRLQFYPAESKVFEASACVDRLERLAAKYPVTTTCAWSVIHFITEFGRARLASGENRLQESIGTLRNLYHEAEISKRHYHTMMLGTELSKALLAANETSEALRTFCDVLRATASVGIDQVVLNGGPQIGKLLLMFQDNARRTGQSRELIPHVDSLIARWRERYDPTLTPSAKTTIDEMLSSREQNILNLIAQGQSNKEIARGLGIAPETVK